MPPEDPIESLIERLNHQNDLLADSKYENEKLKETNINLQEQNAILSHKLAILEPINTDLQREHISILERITQLIKENDELKSGYPANTKALLDRICKLVRDHESVARKLSKKSGELATLKKIHSKEIEDYVIRINNLTAEVAILTMEKYGGI